MWKSGLILAAMLLPVPAVAGCGLASNCSTDSQGNTYITRDNLGGGQNTYRNGRLHSQTQQNLSGGYTERFSNGSRQYHSTNPYNQPGPSGPYDSQRDPFRINE
jgi:hypothetical protein